MPRSIIRKHRQRLYQAAIIKYRVSENGDSALQYFNPLERLIREQAQTVLLNYTNWGESILELTVPRTSPFIGERKHKPEHNHHHKAADGGKKKIDLIDIFKRVKNFSPPGTRIKRSKSIIIQIRERFYVEHLLQKPDVVLLYFSIFAGSKQQVDASVLYEVGV